MDAFGETFIPGETRKVPAIPVYRIPMHNIHRLCINKHPSKKAETVRPVSAELYSSFPVQKFLKRGRDFKEVAGGGTFFKKFLPDSFHSINMQYPVRA
jgi:hypothetical protein